MCRWSSQGIVLLHKHVSLDMNTKHVKRNVSMYKVQTNQRLDAAASQLCVASWPAMMPVICIHLNMHVCVFIHIHI